MIKSIPAMSSIHIIYYLPLNKNVFILLVIDSDTKDRTSDRYRCNGYAGLDTFQGYM